jgi:hypothetical protein
MSEVVLDSERDERCGEEQRNSLEGSSDEARDKMGHEQKSECSGR